MEVRSREHLLQNEMEAMKKKGSRHAHRDGILILVIYRHGLRIEEVSNLKWEQVDFALDSIYIKRIKRGTPFIQPLSGDEIQAVRKL